MKFSSLKTVKSLLFFGIIALLLLSQFGVVLAADNVPPSPEAVTPVEQPVVNGDDGDNETALPPPPAETVAESPTPPTNDVLPTTGDISSPLPPADEVSILPVKATTEFVPKAPMPIQPIYCSGRTCSPRSDDEGIKPVCHYDELTGTRSCSAPRSDIIYFPPNDSVRHCHFDELTGETTCQAPFVPVHFSPHHCHVDELEGITICND